MIPAAHYAPGCVVVVDSRAPVRATLSHDHHGEVYLAGQTAYPLMQPAVVLAVYRPPAYPTTSRGTILGLVMAHGGVGWLVSDDVYPSIVR